MTRTVSNRLDEQNPGHRIKFMVFQTLTRNRDVRVRTIVKFLDKDLRHPAELE